MKKFGSENTSFRFSKRRVMTLSPHNNLMCMHTINNYHFIFEQYDDPNATVSSILDECKQLVSRLPCNAIFSPLLHVLLFFWGRLFKARLALTQGKTHCFGICTSGPVVQSWVNANTGLKFTPVSKFVYFCMSVYFETSGKKTLLDRDKISEDCNIPKFIKKLLGILLIL